MSVPFIHFLSHISRLDLAIDALEMVDPSVTVRRNIVRAFMPGLDYSFARIGTYKGLLLVNM
jgi:hypothetical protein